MPVTTYPTTAFLRGTTAFLIAQITNSLPGMNADIAASVRGSVAITPIVARVGLPPNVKTPTICTSWVHTDVNRFATDGEKILEICVNLNLLLPLAGENTAMNFEAAMQVSAEWTLAWILDDSVCLTPLINCGTLGNVQLYEGEAGPMQVRLKKLGDGITWVRGWEIPFYARFSIAQ